MSTYEIRFRETPAGQKLTGRVQRDFAVYPPTPTGEAKLIADLESVTRPLAVSVMSGSAVVRTLPPLSVFTSWITNLRYSHNGTTLTVIGNGNIGAIKFAYANGTSFTTGNPGGVTGLKNDVFYGHEVVNGERRWQLNLTALPMQITVRNEANNAQVVSYTFSPVAGQANIVLTGSVTTAPTDPTTPPSDALVSTAWDGNSTATPGSQGTQIGNFLQAESTQLRIQLREGFGGMMQVYDKTNGNFPLINFDDLGRLSEICAYGGPQDFAADQGSVWSNIGYNPLPGNYTGAGVAQVLAKGKTADGALYTKSQFVSWAHQNKLVLPVYYEQWAKVTGNIVDVRVKITHFRSDKTLYNSREWEAPLAFINTGGAVSFYNGNNPFTSDSYRTTNYRETSGESFTLKSFYQSEPWLAISVSGNKSVGLVGTDMYSANFNDGQSGGTVAEGGNRFVYLGGKRYSHFDPDGVSNFHYQLVVGTIPEIRAAAYALPRPVNNWYFTQSNGRAGWVGQDGTSDQKEPFSQANWTVTFTGKDENIGGVNQRHATYSTLQSPYGAWKASEWQKVYIKMRYTGTPTTLRLLWLRAGQDKAGLDPNHPNENATRYPNGARDEGAQFVDFNVISDSQIRTYEVNVSANSNWKDIISRIELGNRRGLGLVVPGQVLEIVSITSTNPN